VARNVEHWFPPIPIPHSASGPRSSVRKFLLLEILA
jgi:hypothetical protein